VHSAELQAALDAATAAAEVIRSLYQRNLAVTTKADKSPVTEADVRAEQAIHEVLSSRFPGYGFYGEETGQHGMGAESVWLVDPIDGTKSFVRECPFFSTQIALMRGGRMVLGVSSAPAYGELAWAERGTGAFLGGQRIRVSAVADIGAAIVSTGNLKTLAAGPRWARFGELVTRVNRIRGYGDFVHYHLLARGALDAVNHRREIQGRERVRREHLGGRPVLPAPVPVQHQHMAGVARGERRIVQGRHHAATRGAMRGEQGEQPYRMMRIEVVGRFVQQHQRGFLRQHGCGRDAPLLAA